MWLTFFCSLVTALGAPQWSLKHTYGDEYEPHEHEYCFIRFVLSMFNYHKLALGYSNHEIEVSMDGSPLLVEQGNGPFSIIDDRIEEVKFESGFVPDGISNFSSQILHGGKTPSLAQLTHELKKMIAGHKVTFDSLERATLYHDQLRNALQAYWLMTIMRIKNKKRFVDIAKHMGSIVPQCNLAKLQDLFTNKIEWFKLERNFAELTKPLRSTYYTCYNIILSDINGVYSDVWTLGHLWLLDHF